MGKKLPAARVYSQAKLLEAHSKMCASANLPEAHIQMCASAKLPNYSKTRGALYLLDIAV
jgi:hypothetical protein